MWDLVGFVTGSKSVAKLVLLRCCWSPLTGAARAFSPPPVEMAPSRWMDQPKVHLLLLLDPDCLSYSNQSR